MPLSIVQVVTEKHLFKDAVVLRPSNKNSSIVVIFWPVGDSMPISYEEENATGDFESAMKNAQVNTISIQGTRGEVLAYECLEVSNCMITETYNEPIQTINEKQLHFLRRTQLAEKQIRVLAKEYHSLFGSLSVDAMGTGIKKKSKQKLQNLVAKRDEIVSQIRQTKCWNCAQVSYHLTQLEVQEKYRANL
mmetsp:Transcript_13300/g.16870  ORF Transcript_13300/g.16870 Transcript_13300/m.16870 type:complete len:191 (-) Transcript_13300:693-1265(-)